MELSEIIQSWLEQSADDWGTAEDLLKSKRYAPCLFFIHLAIEKLLKARVVKITNASAPHVHDLVTLAQLANITFTEEQGDYLREVNTFNIRARYDDYKREFYKRATPEFTLAHFNKANEFIKWLRNPL